MKKNPRKKRKSRLRRQYMPVDGYATFMNFFARYPYKVRTTKFDHIVRSYDEIADHEYSIKNKDYRKIVSSMLRQLMDDMTRGYVFSFDGIRMGYYRKKSERMLKKDIGGYDGSFYPISDLQGYKLYPFIDGENVPGWTFVMSHSNWTSAVKRVVEQGLIYNFVKQSADDTPDIN